LLTTLPSQIDWKLVGARSGYITAKGARERFQQLEIGGSTGASSSTSTSSIPTSSSAAASTKEKVGTEVETTRKIDEGQDADMEWVDVGELEDNGSEYGDIVIGLNIARPRATLVLD
jgi:hypothetical protein